ncbi:MAG: response regulator [Nitrospirae bacterium]|nr:response regulator [Nitrospirota bacterium]
MERKIKILVVDDEKLIRWSLGKALQTAGYDVDAATNGDEALQMMEKFRYDIVVTDLRMPGLTGIELLKKIKEKGSVPPVIFVSAYLSNKVIDDAIQSGAFKCVSKPFQMENILHVVREALEFKNVA